MLKGTPSSSVQPHLASLTRLCLAGSCGSLRLLSNIPRTRFQLASCKRLVLYGLIADLSQLALVAAPALCERSPPEIYHHHHCTPLVIITKSSGLSTHEDTPFGTEQERPLSTTRRHGYSDTQSCGQQPFYSQACRTHLRCTPSYRTEEDCVGLINVAWITYNSGSPATRGKALCWTWQKT